MMDLGALKDRDFSDLRKGEAVEVQAFRMEAQAFSPARELGKNGP